MNALKALYHPKEGYASEFHIPVEGPNIAHLANMAKRARELHEGLKSLRATNLLTNDFHSGRLSISSGQGQPTFGFDFQKIAYDCTSTHPLNVVLQDERRQRSLSIRLQPASLDELAKRGDNTVCSTCQIPLPDAASPGSALTCNSCAGKGL